MPTHSGGDYNFTSSDDLLFCSAPASHVVGKRAGRADRQRTARPNRFSPFSDLAVFRRSPACARTLAALEGSRDFFSRHTKMSNDELNVIKYLQHVNAMLLCVSVVREVWRCGVGTKSKARLGRGKEHGLSRTLN